MTIKQAYQALVAMYGPEANIFRTAGRIQVVIPGYMLGVGRGNYGMARRDGAKHDGTIGWQYMTAVYGGRSVKAVMDRLRPRGDDAADSA